MDKVRKTRFDLLARVDPTDLPAIEVITAGMKDPDKAVRASAVGAVLHMGGSAEALAALPALRERVMALSDPVRAIRDLAAKALGMTRDKRVLPTLIKLIHDPRCAHNGLRLATGSPSGGVSMLVCLLLTPPKVRNVAGVQGERVC